jgi:hypothetical protein
MKFNPHHSDAIVAASVILETTPQILTVVMVLDTLEGRQARRCVEVLENYADAIQGRAVREYEAKHRRITEL